MQFNLDDTDPDEASEPDIEDGEPRRANRGALAEGPSQVQHVAS